MRLKKNGLKRYWKPNTKKDTSKPVRGVPVVEKTEVPQIEA